MRKSIFNKQNFKDARRNLRKESTKEESLLWFELRNGKLGFKFKRQESIGRFVVDFYCPKAKLAIEIDGLQHKENRDYDQERTHYLNHLGIKVIRFWNTEINSGIQSVLETARQTLSCI